MSSDRPWHRDAAVVVRTEQRLNPAEARRAAVETEALLRPKRSVNVKGYVVRWDDARGQALYAIRDSTSTVREDATVFATIREAVIEAGDGFATARIVAVVEDGTETPLPTYEEALAQLDAVRAALAVLQRPDTLSSKDMAAGEHATAVEACKVAVGLVDSPTHNLESDRLRGLILAFVEKARLKSTAEGWCNLTAEFQAFDALRRERDRADAPPAHDLTPSEVFGEGARGVGSVAGARRGWVVGRGGDGGTRGAVSRADDRARRLHHRRRRAPRARPEGRCPLSAPRTPPLATLLTLAAIVPVAEESLLPGERSPFRLTAGQDRRTRVEAIRQRTGWVYPRCREVAKKSDAQIEAIVREHEAGRRARERRTREAERLRAVW